MKKFKGHFAICNADGETKQIGNYYNEDNVRNYFKLFFNDSNSLKFYEDGEGVRGFKTVDKMTQIDTQSSEGLKYCKVWKNYSLCNDSEVMFTTQTIDKGSIKELLLFYDNEWFREDEEVEIDLSFSSEFEDINTCENCAGDGMVGIERGTVLRDEEEASYYECDDCNGRGKLNYI